MTQLHGIRMVFPDGKVACMCGNVFGDQDAWHDHIGQVNSDVYRIHGAEQMWAEASTSLDNFIAFIHTQEPELYRAAGGNTDISVIFDFMKSYIIESERQTPIDGHLATVLFCAAAITRLVGAPPTNDVLAQLDKEIDSNDDH